jgi:hypothetical protein
MKEPFELTATTICDLLREPVLEQREKVFIEPLRVDQPTPVAQEHLVAVQVALKW